MRNVISLPIITLLLLTSVFAGQKKDYEEAWIIDTSIKSGVVRIQAVSSRLIIDFYPGKKDLQSFAWRKGCLTYVQFECAKNKDDKCDFASPYLLFVERKLVEVIKIKNQNPIPQ